MGVNSNVGNPQLYEAGDQRNVSAAEVEAARKNRENPPASSRRGSSHAKERHDLKESSSPTDEELTKKDPKAPAKMHGNEPSRGAKVDADLKADDELRLKEKGHK